MQTIEITGATGTGPYDVYVCDSTLTYCASAGVGINIPPNFLYTLVYPLDSVSSVIVKLIDSNGCEFFQLYSCPSPTPTMTPTMTPTPTIAQCNCIQFSNITTVKKDFSYTQCNGTIFYGLIDGTTELLFCGKLPTAEDGVLISVGIPCVMGACEPLPPPLSPTPTPTITLTMTPTPTPTVTPTLTPTPSPLPFAFISVWSASTTIELPYSPTGTYSGIINWGDGNTSVNSYANRTHTYASPGDYTITITGTIEGWNFATHATLYKDNIKEIIKWGPLRGESNSNASMFNACTNLVLTGVTDTPDLTGITSLYSMFASCSSLTTVNNMDSWDVSSVTNMGTMFQNASNFNQYIGSWDVSNVTSMLVMFGGTNMFNQNINTWNVSNVTNMGGMFTNAISFNQPLGNWDVSSVTNMSTMFAQASVFNQDISLWDVSSVTNMYFMFGNATSFNNGGSLGINLWNVSVVTNMEYMFYNTPFNQPIGGWNVSSVTNMFTMFGNTTNFNQNISSWDVSSVTDMGSMFQSANLFDQNLGGWNVSNVTNMTAMFNGITLSTVNYDSLLNGWASLGGSLQSGVSFDGGSSIYTISTAGASRTYLTGTKLWTITDGGGI
jgi:surface protein